MKNVKIINDAKVYVENIGIIRTRIAFDEKILAIGEDVGKYADGGYAAEEMILPDNATVVPAFIDEHIHGAAGYDVMDGDSDGLSAMARSVASEGTAAFLATTVTAPREKTIKALRTTDEYVLSEKSADGAEVLGVHLEGPFLSEEYAGAMNRNYLSEPNEKLLDEFIAASGNRVKIVTYAPEKDAGDDFLHALLNRGIVPSAGHTSATYARIKEATEKGLKNVTHTYNAQSPFKHREAGCVGAALLNDKLACEIIADTIHVSLPALELLVKNKPYEKVIFVTDSMRAKGLGDGISEIGGQRVIVKDGEARLENGTLAGSVLKMNVAVRNMVKKTGLTVEHAVDCASANPAKALGVYDSLGSIAVGKRACLTVLDDDFEVIYCLRDGRVVYERRTGND